ncbi:cytochrome-c peroxidase [Dyella nitratireducens]|uniref:Cytochrome-c peroxidase n=1 Tax=Dyella nitratireducens TaxID=1849580 RepID=A0ABQ1G8N7_9GAMM|nr:cytochrome c peroxidase [Dyella nitratireducens]GGA38932.1 cytochrome-c peroxidase [Dyella nitratireducens]GLQ40378.1 cytochrome-c peroxidase [Dyella nitratireducens]
MSSNKPTQQKRFRLFKPALCAICALSCAASYAFIEQSSPSDNSGLNPHPVHLLLPPTAPLSAVAQLGKSLFFDPMLSGSGKQSCASCHDPKHGYNPPNALTVQPGGAHMKEAGFRPPPSLAYLYRQMPFSIGPDAADTDIPVDLNNVAASNRNDPRASKSAGTTPATVPMVPQGGLFWDGRADSLQRQAIIPMLNPVEMANTSIDAVALKLANSRYRQSFAQLFGPGIVHDPQQLVDEAMFAIGRFEIEDSSFHPFTSKYDAWLQGQARLTAQEMRGLALFNDPKKGNCAACHISQPTRDGLPPLFTDTQYEALGVPRNPELALNKDPRFFDLGVCGPFRKDLANQTQYCGMFLTPTLRNVDRRAVFFHNGVYHNLTQVLDFYNLRSVAPEKIYPRDASGKLALYNDIPAAYQKNVDVTDAPFDLHVGDAPALTTKDIQDIIAFLHTLDDGYSSSVRKKDP